MAIPWQQHRIVRSKSTGIRIIQHRSLPLPAAPRLSNTGQGKYQLPANLTHNRTVHPFPATPCRLRLHRTCTSHTRNPPSSSCCLAAEATVFVFCHTSTGTDSGKDQLLIHRDIISTCPSQSIDLSFFPSLPWRPCCSPPPCSSLCPFSTFNHSPLTCLPVCSSASWALCLASAGSCLLFPVSRSSPWLLPPAVAAPTPSLAATPPTRSRSLPHQQQRHCPRNQPGLLSPKKTTRSTFIHFGPSPNLQASNIVASRYTIQTQTPPSFSIVVTVPIAHAHGHISPTLHGRPFLFPSLHHLRLPPSADDQLSVLQSSTNQPLLPPIVAIAFIATHARPKVSCVVTRLPRLRPKKPAYPLSAARGANRPAAQPCRRPVGPGPGPVSYCEYERSRDPPNPVLVAIHPHTSAPSTTAEYE